MRCLQLLLNISWNNVREEKTINLSIRAKFNNIDSIEILWLMTPYLGKIIRMK